MIVTLKPCPQNFKACLFKKGGDGGGALELSDRAANGVSRIKTRARDLCCIFATLLYLVCFDLLHIGHKKRAILGIALLPLQLGENYSANPNLLSK